MENTRKRIAIEGTLLCAAIAMAFVVVFTAYAVADGSLSPQSSTYTINFDVGPYEEGKSVSMEGEDGDFLGFESKLTAAEDGSMYGKSYSESATQTVTEGDEESRLTDIDDLPLWVIGYRFTSWALSYGEIVMDSQYANKLQTINLDEVAAGFAEAELDVQLSAVWTPYSGYTIEFWSRDQLAEGTALATRDSLGWNSEVKGPSISDDNIAAKISNDNAPELAFMFDNESVNETEWAKVEWYTEPDGKGLLWSDGKFVYDLVKGEETDIKKVADADRAIRQEKNGKITLYPYYDPAEVTINYYGNRSASDNESPLTSPVQHVTVGEEFEVQGKGSLEKNGNASKFIGWSYSSSTKYDESDQIISPGTMVKVTSAETPIRLYAVWKDTYTVNYDTNGGSPATIDAKTVDAETATGLLPDSLTLSKVGFETSGSYENVEAGWYVKDATSGEPTGDRVQDTDSFSSLYSTAGGTDGSVTLIYVYAPKQYTLVYDWNGGFKKDTSDSAPNYTKTDQTWDAAIADPPSAEVAKVERPGYTLDYWTLADETTQLSPSSTYGAYSIAAGNTTGNTATPLTVKAHWAPQAAVVNYISLEPDGALGTISGSIAQVTKDKEGNDLLAGGTVTLPSDGYSLEGWTLSEWWTGIVTDKGEGDYEVSLGQKVGDAGADWAVASDVNNLYTKWTANSYTVVVHGDSDQTINATYDTTVIEPTAPTNVPTGYTFEGWATSENVHSTSHADFLASSDGKYTNLTATSGATVNLYPVYVPQGIEVTLSTTNPATNETTETKVTKPADSTGATLDPAPAVNGYVFKGWYANEDGTGDVYGSRAGTSKTDPDLSYDGTMDGSDKTGCITKWPTSVVTLHAVYTELDGYSVTFANNTTHSDSFGEPANVTVDKVNTSEDIKWTSSGFVPDDVAYDTGKSTDGYVFKGWFAADDLNADGTVKDGKTPIAVDAKYSDVATKLGLADTNKSGAVLCAGWEADDTEVVLYNGAFTAKNNVQRTPKTSDDATTAKIDSKVDANPDLPCPFTIDGYKFKYWQQGSGNDAKYYDAAGTEVDSSGTALTPASKFKAGLKESAGNELTAVWQPITYTVKYDDGSGNKSATTLDVTYDDYAGKKLAAADLFTKDGYQFKEWKNSATSGDEAGKAYEAESDITTNLSAAAGDVVLVAQWSAQVTFTFSKGDGELIAGGELPANQMLLAGSEWNKTDVPYVPVAVQRVGYTANGWTDGAGNDYKHADAGAYTVPDITTPKTVSLYPKWVPNAASVVLHFKDGKTDDLTVSTDTSGAGLVTGASMNLPDSTKIEKPGYKFVGWSVSDDDAVDQADGDVDASAVTYVAPAVKTSPSHLYAVWKAEPITVKFDASSGAGNMADQTDLVAGDETGKLAANAYVRDGYTFAGWVLKSNKADKIDDNGCLVSGKAVDYANAQQFTEVSPGPVPEVGDNLVVQLYAAWQPMNFTITFKPNGDGVTPAVEGTQTVSAADSPVTLEGPAYSRDGYVFDGWSTSTSRTAYVAGSDWKNNDEDTKYTLDLSGAAGSNTLYAIWKPADGVTYTIERYKQNLADDGWDKVATAEHDELIGEQTGTTGETVSIATDPADLYEGFTLDSSVTDQTIESATVSTKLSGEVAADGTLVLRAFYTRNAHTVTYQLTGATSPSGWQLPANEASVKYGASKTVRTEDAVDGWEFSGWTGSYVDAEGNTQTISGTYDMPDANVVFTGEWTQKPYKVTFGVNDGATYEGVSDKGAVANTPQSDIEVLSGQKMSADQKTAAQDVSVTVPTPASTDGKHYYHAGWQKKVGDGAWADCGDPWDEVITDDTVFAPVFKPSFAVVYKPGIGGDWTAADETYDNLEAGAEYASFSFPKKDGDAAEGAPKAKAGYTFAGWKLGDDTYNTTADFQTYVTNDHEGKIWGNLTLEAQWTRDAQSFKIDLDGGKVTAATTIVAADAAAPAQAVTANVGDEGPIEASVGTGLEVTMPAVSKPGCTFGGWSVEPTGSLTSPVGTGGVFYMPALAAGDTLTLKPIWIAGSATITYRSANADMGSVSPTQQVVNTSTGAVSSATPAEATATLGSEATAAYGYTFDAWKRVDDASNLLADVTDNAITPKAGDDGFTDRTYEASFKADSFEVTIADATLPDGCSVSKGDLPDSVKVDYLGTLPAGEVIATAVANSGYTFAGWLYSMDDDGDVATDPVANDESSLLSDPAELTIKGPVTFTPVFTPNKVDVVYNLNDPAVANAADNTTYAEKADVGSDYTVKGISVLTALDGYVFKGWATASDGAVVYSADDIAAGTADKLKVPAAGTTLYAIWQGATVDITYLPGRHAAEGAENHVDSTHAAGESNVPVKTNADAGILPADGYMFAGWEGSDGVLYLDPDDPKAAIARLNGPMTMTAQWKLSMSNIVYYANGGYSPDGRGTEIKVDAAAKLQVVAWSVDTVTKGNEGKPIFARDGYTFATWNTRSSGDGDERVPGQIFTMPDSGGVNLYAQWTADAAKLTFDAGDGTFAGNRAQIERSGVTDDKVTMGELPTLSGYELKGFSRTPGSLVADDDLKDVDENTEFTLGKQGEDGAYEANSTLNAVWVKDGCFVATVSADGVTGGSLEGAGDYEVEDGAGLPANVVATPDEGYELDGWEVNGTLVAEPDPTKLQITEDCTIKPHFKAQSTTPVETYKVTVPAGVQNGSVKGAGVYDVEAGKGIPEGAVVATPATGYKLDGWLVNGTLYNETDPSKIAIGADTELVPQFSPEEVEEAVDKTALNQAIIVAKAAEEGVETSADGSDVDPADQWTTPAAKKVLDNAIEAAQKVADDPDATQAQVDAATAAVNAARTAYNAAKANGTKGTGKDGGSGNGQGTDHGKDSDGGNGSGGDNGSGNAKANDKSALESAIAAAKAAEQDVETSADGTDVSPSSTWTTPAEKKALDEAIAAAEAVLADPDATQDDVNAAKMSLDTARAAYNAGKRPGTKPADGDGADDANGGNGSGNGNGNDGNGAGNDSPAGELGKVQAMHRLYNPYSGEHFYTANVAERDDVVAAGWIYEGVGWVAPVESGTPVYRAYSGTDHHYTANWSEIEDIVAAGWTYEGIGWYSDDAESVPLFRQYNPYVEPWADFNNSGSHNYTVDKAENDFLVEVGWIAEGIGWYAIAPDEASIPDGYELVEPQHAGANGSSDLVAAGF